MTYKIGKKYTVMGGVVMCENGFHFCKYLEDIEGNYIIAQSRIFEIKAEGKVISENNKFCAESITLARELSKEEICQYFADNQERILKKGCDCRKALVDQGLCLHKLSYDKNSNVRAAVARQGYGLNTLIHDEDIFVREEVVKQGYGLDVLVHDKDPWVRAAVAKQYYGLDTLIKDEEFFVRMAVAESGYGLDILINDKNPWVRNVALNKLKTLQ